MAGNMDFIGRLLAPYLAHKLGRPASFVGDIPWQERERRFDRGSIHIVWICGLPYIHKAADPRAHIALLAAPVPAGARYGGRPVYFSDIVVRRYSPYYQFDDLRGATWAYNEPHSHSGYTTIRCYLARRHEGGDFFGRVIESVAHETSLQLILEGAIPAIVLAFLGLPYPLAAAGIALGLRGREGSRRRLASAAVASGALVVTAITAGYVVALLAYGLARSHASAASQRAPARGGALAVAPTGTRRGSAVRQ